jgi:hypothetical protein
MTEAHCTTPVPSYFTSAYRVVDTVGAVRVTLPSVIDPVNERIWYVVPSGRVTVGPPDEVASDRFNEFVLSDHARVTPGTATRVTATTARTPRANLDQDCDLECERIPRF